MLIYKVPLNFYAEPRREVFKIEKIKIEYKNLALC